MLIGILSDTHNEAERTQRAVGLLHDRGATVLIHCGDISEPEMSRVTSRSAITMPT